MLNSWNKKEGIDIENMLQKEGLLLQGITVFSRNWCVHFEPSLGWLCAYVYQN